MHAGKACERLGRRDEALSAYRRFLDIWKLADPQLPDLVDARGRVARLESQAKRIEP